MPGVTCLSCGALTDTRNGTCDVCKKPLPGYAAAAPPASNTVYGAAPVPKRPDPAAGHALAAPPFSPYGPGPIPYVAAPGYPAYPVPPPYGFYPPPPYYAPPPYLAPGYAPGYGPVTFEPRAAALARQASGDRWGASAVDGLIVVPLSVLTAFLALWTLGVFVIFGGFLLPWVMLFSYYSFQDGIYGRTLGKRALGLVVVDKDFRRIRLSSGLVRVQELWMWFLLGLLIMGFLQSSQVKKTGQGFGDRWAGAYVVRASDIGGLPARAPA